MVYAPRDIQHGIFEHASAEELPNYVKRSALQRVIQILKYQRDTYYSKLQNGDDIKPISALITTLAARIASDYEKKDCSVFGLLKYVLTKLEICIHQIEMPFEQFSLKYSDSPVISYKNKKWSVINPADPDDNLADKCNTGSDIPNTFFKWVTVTKNNLFDLLEHDDDNQFGVFLENSFRIYDPDNPTIKKYRKNRTATPIDASAVSKPYLHE